MNDFNIFDGSYLQWVILIFCFQELALRSTNMNDPAGELTQIGDPFLGQSTTSDSHARQGSTDSGLGTFQTVSMCIRFNWQNLGDT